MGLKKLLKSKGKHVKKPTKKEEAKTSKKVSANTKVFIKRNAGEIKQEIIDIYKAMSKYNQLNAVYIVSVIGDFLNWLGGDDAKLSTSLSIAAEKADKIDKEQAKQSGSESSIPKDTVN